MSDSNDKYILSKRAWTIASITILVVMVYVLRLFYLQIYQNEYKDFADSNAFFKKVLYPARGTISDRTGKLLVYNQPTYDIVFIPREVQNFDTLGFCQILGISKPDFEKRMQEVRNSVGYSRYTLQTFMTQLNAEEYGLIQEKLYKFPGFSIQNRTMRQYNYTTAGNILGYVAEVSKSRLEEDSYYNRGDYEGKSGVEKSYEELLRGVKGVEVLLRDARGRIQGKYNNGENDQVPVSGKNLKLSIDMDLQAYGEYLMQNKLGAIVMLEPSTGEILCMVTAPSYNPMMLTGGRNFKANYKTLADDPAKPLLNRPVLGTYPPGSTFKLSQGLIFLQEEAITTTAAFPCYLGYPPLGRRPKCHPHASPINFVPAVATSCNAYFCYGLNAMLNNRKKYKSTSEALEVWKNYLVKMGFGYKTGVDLPSEKRGFIPNSKFYTKAFKSGKWNASSIISVSIGQGEITTTPLQIANLAATIANRGYFYTPHIVKEIEGQPLDEAFTKKHYTGVDARWYEYGAEGMARAVTGGTCRGINLLPEIEVCGKTGTAQATGGDDHSWFMGFAPRHQPKVAIAVLVENAGFGARFAVPIARLMVEKYLKGEVVSKGLEAQMASKAVLPVRVRAKRKSNADSVTQAQPTATVSEPTPPTTVIEPQQ